MAYDFLCAGAVWHGPWHTGLVAGSFGGPENQHYAMTDGCKEWRVFLRVISFFPFTSKKNKHFLLKLPPGSVSWGNPLNTSYLLNIRLIVALEDLNERFEFQATTPEDVFAEFKRNYKAALKARKRKK